ncbi:uncharacterized protein PSFLO_01057 [Pseudozyma flocculosa]|uniref:Uncharacterized protein n=1 Tax=Pseudozyma flocculosa TaxID=84751 RepID=A0A5C3EVP1_9BASI|nr:uncharacterized protein PSFLO_01057 [Pseudozyma flocculosa]
MKVWLTGVAVVLASAAMAAPADAALDEHTPVVQPHTPVVQPHTPKTVVNFQTAQTIPQCLVFGGNWNDKKCLPAATCGFAALSWATDIFFQKNHCKPAPASCDIDVDTFCKMCSQARGVPGGECAPS